MIPIISQNTEGETIHEKIYFLSSAGSGSFRRHGIRKEIARCLLPNIIAFYESEDGQQEFEEWKKNNGLKEPK